MAEWSKAPDSRAILPLTEVYGVFWSSYEGVGSNPTSDKGIFALISILRNDSWSTKQLLAAVGFKPTPPRRLVP